MRYRSLDLWRGVACLLVIMFHAAIPAASFYAQQHLTGTLFERAANFVFLRGWIGVPIFFVISGYCITASALGGYRRGRSTVDYFKRRIRRIYPPYWAILALLLLLGLNGTVTSLSPRQWIGTLTLTENWLFHMGSDGRHLYLNPAWSLCYEEQFYALAGLLVLVAPKRFFTAAAALTCAVAAIAVTARVVAVPIGGFFFDGRWLSFAAGILVYWQVNEAKPGERRVWWLLGALALCGVALRRGPLGWHYEFYSFEIFASVGFAGILIILHRHDLAIDTSSYLRPVRFCGVLCYTLYLVHEAVVGRVARTLFALGATGAMSTVAFTIPVSIAASVGVGWIFYILVERRFVQPSPPNQVTALTPDRA